MFRLAILGSGSGSNAKNLLEYFAPSHNIEIGLIAHNKPNIGIVQHALDFNIPTYLLTKENFQLSNTFLHLLIDNKIDWIILAGFLWKLPPSICHRYSDKILNIHPSLLPKYGGKGMYGKNVHNAVLDNNEQESGISIHLVNEEYDEGKLIFQKATNLFFLF